MKQLAETILTDLQHEAMRILAQGEASAWGILYLDCGIYIRCDVTAYDVSWMLAVAYASIEDALFEPDTFDAAANALAHALESTAVIF